MLIANLRRDPARPHDREPRRVQRMLNRHLVRRIIALQCSCNGVSLFRARHHHDHRRGRVNHRRRDRQSAGRVHGSTHAHDAALPLAQGRGRRGCSERSRLDDLDPGVRHAAAHETLGQSGRASSSYDEARAVTRQCARSFERRRSWQSPGVRSGSTGSLKESRSSRGIPTLERRSPDSNNESAVVC